MRLPTSCLPVAIRERHGSESKLNTLQDGTKILWLAIRMLHREYPLRLYGLLSIAVAVAEANVRAVAGKSTMPGPFHFATCDFREGPNRFRMRDLSLMITNPPLGKRVPVADLRLLVDEVFRLANQLLRDEGRLVFINPLETRPKGGRLRLTGREKVDVGFAHFHLEKYVAD
jgi:23S rRNA G2445 N2-methylase RlmL